MPDEAPALDRAPEEEPAPEPRVGMGIDVGGSGIKGALVDLDSGMLLTDRIRMKTPKPATPKACIKVIRELVRRIAQARPIPADAPVGLGIPAAVIDGITVTAVNIDDEWLGFAAADALADALGRPVRVLNDADAAGVGEMRFGAGRGQRGTVVVVTLGTGVGTALFHDGRLLPNTELGHIEVRGKDAELRASAASRARRHLSWTEYASELDEYLHKLDMLIWPDLIIIGGGISKDAERFVPRLSVRARVLAAENRNNAGIVGAATVAAEAMAARLAASDRPEPG